MKLTTDIKRKIKSMSVHIGKSLKLQSEIEEYFISNGIAITYTEGVSHTGSFINDQLIDLFVTPEEVNAVIKSIEKIISDI